MFSAKNFSLMGGLLQHVGHFYNPKWPSSSSSVNMVWLQSGATWSILGIYVVTPKAV